LHPQTARRGSDFLGSLAALEGVDQHVGAGGRQLQGHGATDAAGGARDHGHAAGKLSRWIGRHDHNLRSGAIPLA
jgi:hypothetical protein